MCLIMNLNIVSSLYFYKMKLVAAGSLTEPNTISHIQGS